MLSSDQKGAIAETAVIHEAVKLGIGVLKPVNDGLRYDLVLDIDEQLVRVQVKWAPRHADVVIIRAYSCRRTRDGLVRRPYTPEEVDAYAAYCRELDRCYFLPIAEFVGQKQIQLRVAPAKNNQTRGIIWDKDYEFTARLGAHQGAVAQLGERAAGSREVRGSIPLGSIDSVR